MNMPFSTALIAHSQDLAQQVIEQMYADPFWKARYGDRGREHALQDAQFHISYLVQALEANNAGLFQRYARWLQSILVTRGMCSLHLADSYTKLGQAISATLADTHTDRALNILQAGCSALLYPSGPGRELQERARQLIQQCLVAEGASQDEPASTTAGPAYTVSYLGDALQAKQPALLADYLTFWEKQPGSEPANHVHSQLGRLDRALGQCSTETTTAARALIAAARSQTGQNNAP